MSESRATQVMLGLCAAVLVAAALYLAASVFAPVAFSLLVIVIVWPLQRALQRRIPTLLALLLAVLTTIVAIALLASVTVWGFGRIGQWLVGNAARAQDLYMQVVDWLEEHGILVAAPLAEQFNVGWLIRSLGRVTQAARDLLSFAILTFIFALLGLLEVEVLGRNIEAAKSAESAQALLRAGASITAKLQKYALVRFNMSVLTGALVAALAWLVGLDLAAQWGVVTFALNFIPFIGPLAATVLMTLFAFVQLASWQSAIAIFLCLNLIQFVVGSYLEPRLAGAALAISPFMVLFSVFFWGFLWGIPGAIIGVPIVIALLTVCEQYSSSRWIAALLSGRDRAGD
jgi:predicted PurR-regulated permease PerM